MNDSRKKSSVRKRQTRRLSSSSRSVYSLWLGDANGHIAQEMQSLLNCSPSDKGMVWKPYFVVTETSAPNTSHNFTYPSDENTLKQEKQAIKEWTEKGKKDAKLQGRKQRNKRKS